MFQSVLRRLRESQTVEPESMGAAEAGFTLIELMVVLLIIAILLAIAIPTFLGVTSSANDRATQSNLTNGLTEAASQYQAANQSYTGVQGLLVQSAPEFSWLAGTTCTAAIANCISVAPFDVAATGDVQGVVLAALSKTGTCWWIAQLQTAPNIAGVVAASGFEYTTFASGTFPAAGMEENANASPVAGITTAGAYYAKKTNPGAHCNAAYPPTVGFKWGPSYAIAGVN